MRIVSQMLGLVAALTLLVGLSARVAAVPQNQPDGLADLEFIDSRYLLRSLSELGAKRATVVAFLTPDCPLARRGLALLADLERDLRERGVAFVGLDPSGDASVVEIAAAGLAAGAEFPFGIDEGGRIARALSVERTPTVCVLDEQRKLIYRGRIDAALRLGGDVVVDPRADLREALEDLLVGRPVRVPSTPVDGCLLDFEPLTTLDRDQPPTWADSVGAIVREHCAGCHIAEHAAPFELWSYRDTARRAARIAEVVRRRQMPPWHASQIAGEFVNTRRLSEEDRERILAWIKAGVPPGDVATHPDPPHPAAAPPWRIGEPDLVLTQLGRTKLPADGVVPYQYVVIPHVFTADTWIEACEIRPENPRAVHHANLGWVRFTGQFTPENFITGYVPGGDVYELEPGQAYLIPAGAVLGLQAHYVTTGEETSDRLSIGLRFPRGPVQQRARHLEISNSRFRLAPFAPAQSVSATRSFEGAATGIGMFVHMHLRGRDVDVRAIEPDGREERLLVVPNYDFDWQSSYRWARGAQHFSANERVRAVARYDNSRFNVFNPDPAARVSVGQATSDEMMYVFLFYTLDQEQLGIQVDPRTGVAR